MSNPAKPPVNPPTPRSSVTVALNVTDAHAAILRQSNASDIVTAALSAYQSAQSRFLRMQVNARLDKLTDQQVASLLTQLPVVTPPTPVPPIAPSGTN